MKKRVLLAALASTALSGVMAKADFVVTGQRYNLGQSNVITGGANTNGSATTTSGYDLIEFFAENNGLNNTGSTLTGGTVTMTDATSPSNNLVIGGYTGHGAPSGSSAPDLTGAGEVGPNTNGSGYAFVGYANSQSTSPSYYSFMNVLGDPSNSAQNSPNNLLVNIDSPSATYTNYQYGINSFTETLGTSATNGAVNGVNATTANGGLGALFAVAVVPTGDSVSVSGTLLSAGGSNTSSQFAYTNAVATPEPASLGIFGIALASLISRRRRA